MFKTATLVLLLATVSGCASYQPPGPAEPHATLTVKNASPHELAIFTHKEPETCGGVMPIRTGVGRTIYQNNVEQEVSVLVPADKLFGLYASATRRDHNMVNTIVGCGIVATFTPRRGASYVAEYAYSGASCTIAIRELRDGAPAQIPVRYRRQMPTSFSHPNPYCAG